MFNNHDSSEVFWRPRLGCYTNKSKNAELFVAEGKDGKPDPSQPVEATSYGWWIFFLKVGKTYVFNSYHYSSQTGAHQRGVRDMLKKLGIAYVEVSTRAHLGEPDEVLSELQANVIRAEERLAFTHSKRCKGKGWITVEEQRTAARERLDETRRQLEQFVDALRLGKSKVSSSRKEAQARLQREDEERRQAQKTQRERYKSREKEKKEILAASWKHEEGYTLPHAVERPEYRVEPTGDETLDKVLTAFLTTDETRKRFGNFFIDGTDLVYRCVVRERGNYGPLVLAENVVARKLFSEDGQMIIVGNSSTLDLIGRTVYYGRVRLNRSETEIQKHLKQYVTMVPFREFRKQETYNETLPEVPITLATVTIYRLTGKVPRGVPSAEQSEAA